MYNLCPGSNVLHNEGTKARRKRDNDDEDALLVTLQRFDVFVDDVQCASLKNVATKDLATDAKKHSTNDWLVQSQMGSLKFQSISH